MLRKLKTLSIREAAILTCFAVMLLSLGHLAIGAYFDSEFFQLNGVISFSAGLACLLLSLLVLRGKYADAIEWQKTQVGQDSTSNQQ